MSPEIITLIWTSLIATAVFLYVLLDGFDLGIGILFAARGEEDRDLMMNAVAPVWDGNETWLVLGVGGLLAMFPLAYNVIMAALYIPATLMVVALIFRGVAFEFRFKARTSGRYFWGWAFFFGSAGAAFCQGLILGGVVQGIPVNDGQFAGGPFNWLTPFSFFAGLGVMAGYALLGACWLIFKTEGALQAWARALAPWLVGAVLVAMGGVSLWMPLASEEIAARWFSLPEFYRLMPIPLAVLGLAGALLWALRQGRELLPYFLTMGLFLLGYLGIGISLWPHIVPPSVTIWNAATDPESQVFLLVGVLVLLPFILAYTGYAYWVFRGKVRPGEGYGH